MKQGDFTELAKHYHHRTGYSEAVLTAILRYVGLGEREDFCVAEVGAGTGKLTEILVERGLRISAVEPNDAMREEGVRQVGHPDLVQWSKGSGESTGLAAASADWAVMASSFHWTDPNRSLPEFARVLKPGGFLTVMWNPRNLSVSDLHMRIEARIHELAPSIERRSSGSAKYTKDIDRTLVSTGHFEDVIFIEGQHQAVMTRERYMGAWESTNDIQAQVGEERWAEILRGIETELGDLREVVVPYKTRSWTARRTER